jgi:outer membrane protein TolC
MAAAVVVAVGAAMVGGPAGCATESAWHADERIIQVERGALAEARRRDADGGGAASGVSAAVARRSPPASPSTPGEPDGAFHRPFEIRPVAAAPPDAGRKPDPTAKTSIKKEDLLKLNVDEPMTGAPATVTMRLSDAVRGALRHSHQVAFAGYTPAIKATEMLEAQGAFDPVLFFRGDGADSATGFPGVLHWNKDQPPASTLGGAIPLQSSELSARFGIRQLLPTGAVVQLSQRFSYVDSSNVFLSPNPQSASSLSLAIIQPLLRGAGLDVNRAKIFIGSNNKEIGLEEFRRIVIRHLADVEQAYWNLMLARYVLAIQRQLLELQTETARRLDARQDILPYTRDLARATVAQTEAAVIRSRNGVRDAQDRLKVLINDPELTLRKDVEILPSDPLTDGVVPIDDPVREASLRAALDNRPEIRQARLEIRSAAVREGVSRNELLPQLNVLAELVPQGVAGRLDNAFNQQWRYEFQDWIFGVTLEIPLGNRTARAHFRRDRLLREQAIAQLSNTVQTAYFEVSTALNNLDSTQQEIPARRRGLEAAAAELAARTFLVYESTPREQIGSALEFLLTSQQRLAQSHQALAESRTAYNNGIVRLEQAKGTLLHYNNIEPAEEVHLKRTPGLFYEPADAVPAR